MMDVLSEAGTILKSSIAESTGAYEPKWYMVAASHIQ